MQDFRGNLVDRAHEYFYYAFLHSENKKNIDGQLKLDKNSMIGYSICKEEDFDPEIYIQKNLKDYFCMNLNTKNSTFLDFGGGWDGDFINYIFAGIMACKENSFNFQKGIPCGSDKKRKEIITNGIVSSIMVPYVLFDPSNFENPFIMDMKFISFGIDDYLVKNLNFKFQNKIVESDVGWIFQQMESNQMLSYMTHSDDSIYYLSMKDNSFGSAMSTVTLEMDKQVIKYYRKYMKIQELLANVGGILKVISTVSFYLGSFINNLYLNLDLLNFIQTIYPNDYKEKDLESNKLKTHAISLATSKKVVVLIEQNNSVLAINKQSEFKGNNNSKLENNKEMKNDHYLDKDVKLKDRLSKLEHYCSFSKDVLDRIETECHLKKVNKKPNDLKKYSFCNYFKHFIKFSKKGDIEYYETKYQKNLDILEYIKTKIKQEKIIKLLFSEVYQEHLFN